MVQERRGVLIAGERIDALEGVRGLALLPVFAVHYVTLFGFLLGRGAESPAGWEDLGQAGVDLFFLLSGYLVYGLALDRRVTLGAFLRRRCRRIYPAYLAVFVLYVGLSIALPARSKIPQSWGEGGWYLMTNLLLLPGIFDIPPLIRVAWSLSYEAAFYTLLPVVVWATGAVRRTAQFRLIVILSVAVIYWWACWLWGDWYLKPVLLSPLGHPRLVLFLVGMVVREAHGAGWKLPGRCGWWVVCFGLALCGVWWNPVAASAPRQCVEALWMAVGGGAMIYWAGLPGNWVAEQLSWGWLRWLGKVSYSYYLVHGLVIHGLSYGLGVLWNGRAGAWWFAALIPIVFAAAAGVAAVLYSQVEKRLSLAPRGPASDSVALSAASR